jgi:pectate lyase
MNLVASNKTIIGLGDRTTITGGGLNVSRAHNVIVRNLSFSNWNDDAINVEYSTNVWVDHNTFNHGYDGCVDIKRASDFVTVSWNKFVNHDKVSLVGHSDSNSPEDTGHLRVTYHHNWFDGTVQRHPRVRFGNPVHVYNNYYVQNSGYSIASTMNAGVLVEGNYFERVDTPFSLQKGNLVAKNNVFVDVGHAGITKGTVAPIPYPYVVDDPSTLVERIKAGAGAP